MAQKIPSEIAEALNEIQQSTAKTATDKVLVALAAVAWPAEKPAEEKAPEGTGNPA